MFRKAFLVGCLCCAASTAVYADFSYEQTSKVTGGALAGMMKLAGAFSKAAREPVVSTVIVKGDQMAHISKQRISVIDLKSETMTDIDLQKKTYAVITFADMQKAMQRMQEKVAEKKGGDTEKKPGGDKADVNFKVSLKETGQTKMVSGFNAKEFLMTLAMEGTDKETGQSGAMTVTADMWLAPKIAGYDEIQDFYRRMSKKIAWTPGDFGMPAQRPDMAKGFGEITKEAAKMDGVPVLQIVKMGVAGDAMTAAPGNGNQTAARPPAPPPPTAGDVAGAAIANKLGLGGFGGFGRKKKNTDEQAPPAQPAAANGQPADASGALIEMTTELTSFSSGPVDPSKFEVPAGFKKVEHDMEKALR